SAVVFLKLHATGPFPVRLSAGPNLCAGRVEVFHQDEWGTVCDDDWDMRDVAVVCRELNCGEALSAPHGAWFGEGAGPIWLNEVRCAGTEWQLHSCRHLGFRKHVCTHEEDASAICSEQRFPPFTAFPPHTTFRRGKIEATLTTKPLVSPTPAEGTPAVRLMGGRSHCSGRLEVYHEGQWGTVCDDMWDLLDVAVVCRELDCGEALAAPGGSFFGEGTSVIWLDDVQCQGEEATLAECHTSPWGTNNCRHTEDAGAVCSGEMPLAMVEEHVAMLTRTLPPQRPRSAAPQRIPHPTQPTRDHRGPVAHEASSTNKSSNEGLSEQEQNGQWQVRLTGGPGSCAGRVEVLYKGHWGTICDDGWDLVDAAVVCRELGCGAPLLSPGNARYGPGSGPIWLDDVNCTGAEFTLRRCRSQPWGKHNCNHHEDASVICTGKWKRLSLSKPSKGPKIVKAVTTTHDPRPAEKPGLQNNLDVFETTTTTQGFTDEWATESLSPWHLGAPVQPTQKVDLEPENKTRPVSHLDRAETTPNPEILQHVQEPLSTESSKTRSTTHAWEHDSYSPSAKSQPSSEMWSLESERETELTTSGEVDKPMSNSENLLHVQEIVSTPKTRSTMHTWEQESTYPPAESHPTLAMWDLESERETEPITAGDMNKPTPNLEILQHVQDMVSTQKSRLTMHKWEQEPTSPSAESQPFSSLGDLEYESETEPSIAGDMDKPTPNLEIMQHVQGMKSTTPETRSIIQIWGQEPNYPSTESQPSSAMWNLDSEKERELTTTKDLDKSVPNLGILQHVQEIASTHPSKTSPSTHEQVQAVQDLKSEGEHKPTSSSVTVLPIVTQDLKPTAEMPPTISWDRISEVPPVIQDTKPTRSLAEVQPTAATWDPEPGKEREATSHVIKELFLFSKSLETTKEKELPTVAQNVLSITQMGTIDPNILDSEKNIDKKHQEESNVDAFSVGPIGSTSAFKDLSSLKGTDVYTTTKLPRGEVSMEEQFEDGLVSSGDTETRINDVDSTSIPGLSAVPGPNVPTAKPVTHATMFSESSSGCPIKQESKKEDQGCCCCSPPALGSLAQAMEGLRGELGSLSMAVQHQGSQLGAVAHSLAELAASVHHLVEALPTLLQPVSTQASASCKQDEGQLQNQLPLK
ncbi:soluble scavenger receptor cysteine-rich domain-containing protein SSC5D-like, partial [Varanus komodoensis]|uniref:soluble scavenger receptor cysteine-rich domain-containing protein SSC5D-like n=1 Tax=Varanus komodoensis TaxID=61221 RepID=UPI001CF7C000